MLLHGRRLSMISIADILYTGVLDDMISNPPKDSPELRRAFALEYLSVIVSDPPKTLPPIQQCYAAYLAGKRMSFVESECLDSATPGRWVIDQT
jgi:hypothetical protein